MRDYLCNEKDLIKTVELNEEFIKEDKEDISQFREDIKNNIQRNPNSNEACVEGRYNSIYMQSVKSIKAKYSLGYDVKELESDFSEALNGLINMGEYRAYYVNLLWMVGLGILLERSNEEMELIAKVIEKEEINDPYLNYLLSAIGIEWNKKNNKYVKENPYKNVEEIINLAFEGKKKEASKRLEKYMKKEWFKGHYDYEWRNAHKRYGYYGIWSFDTAALVKILNIDDSSLKDDNHYPYDLAHYKNERNYEIKPLVVEKKSKPKVTTKGITENRELEKIIPPEYQDLINQIILDYKKLSDKKFYDKYKETEDLGQIWFTLDDYKSENKEKNILGMLIVFTLTWEGYIKQYDYKEELIDCIPALNNLWETSDVKIINFILDNDQNYVAIVPKERNVGSIYEIEVRDCEEEYELDMN